MIAPQIFQVATEFRFDVGEAVANSRMLQGAVGQISSAADEALMSFQRLGLGIVGQMGLATGSVMGLLGAAIQASDKFGQSQRKMANIFLSNNLFKGADAFEQAMAQAAANMETIRKKAQEFGLPASDMTSTTTLIGATLVNKGLDSSNFHRSTDLARGFLKSAPTLGIDPSQAQGELLRAVQGMGHMNDTLFVRLMNETSAMRPFKGNSQAFNTLPEAKRVQVLTQALLQFGSNTKILEGNAHSLTGEFQRLKDATIGMYSVLRPLGDVILNFVLPTLHLVVDYIQTHGAKVMQSFARLVKGITNDPESLGIALLQARRAKGDLKAAGEVAGLYGLLLGIVHGLHFLGVELKFTGALTGALRTGFSYLGTALSFAWGYLMRFLMFVTGASTAIAALWSTLNGVFVFLVEVLKPLMLFFAIFQLISRAIAIAHIEDLKHFAEFMPDFMDAITRLKVVIGFLIEPFTKIFDSMARGISPLFRMSRWFDFAITLMNFFADALMLFQATFQGIVYAIMQMVDNIRSLQNPFKGVRDAFNAGIDDKIEEIMKSIEEGKLVVNPQTNINKVEINNQFKEQMEPDRIAFTLKDQLLKAAANAGQASGRSAALLGAGVR